MKLSNLIGTKVHFIGIGGVSMSGIAAHCASIGIVVQGSDSAIADSKYLEGFEEKGIKLFYGHIASNITPDVRLIVKTSTIKEDNPEIVQAKAFGIEIIERFDILSTIVAPFKKKIGISGSSGKTTTTALAWQALCNQIQKPSCVIGTVLREFASSICINEESDICVIEADESDGMFSGMAFNVAVITDIDGDHLDHKSYNGNRANLIAHFDIFAKKTLESDGIVIYNINCKTTAELMKKYHILYGKNVYSYSGLEVVSSGIATNIETGSVHLTAVQNTDCGLLFSCHGLVNLTNATIPIIGKINAFNAMPGVILAKLLLNVVSDKIFENFCGAQKRCEIIGTVGNITIVDDYAHSPKKIKAFIQSFSSYAHDINAKFVIICEPHKYTRVAALYNDYITCFDSCPNLIMMEIFGIQGKDLDGNISSHTLVADIEKHWNNIKSENKYIKSLKNNNKVLEGDTLPYLKEFQNINIQAKFGRIFYVFLGAGFSSKYAHLLYHNLNMK